MLMVESAEATMKRIRSDVLAVRIVASDGRERAGGSWREHVVV